MDMSASQAQHDRDSSSSQLNLSQDEVERLLNDDSPQVRVDVMGNVAAGYEKSAYGERETAIAEQIFRTLVQDTEKSVRIALAERFMDSTQIPRDIIRRLAQDEDDDVALPVVESSPLLSDNDLVAIINDSPILSRMLAISRRKTVSEVVSSALIGVEEEVLLSSLLKNDGARISDDDYRTIIDNNSDNESVMSLMIERAHLPAAIAERIISSVSESLAARLKNKYNILGEEGAREIDRQVEKTREKATLRLLQNLPGSEEIHGMVHRLHTEGRLTPSLVFSALCHGHTGFFAAAMARLAGIPVSNTTRLINDRGQLGFPALYARSGLPESLLPATSLVIRGMHHLENEGVTPGTAEYADRLAEFVLAAAETENIPKTSYMLALIRQNYME